MRLARLNLPATVWLLGAISLLNDTASEMIYPLLPLYVTGVLLAGPRALGLIEGLAEAASSLLKLVSGTLVDRSGRTRPWIITGYGLAAASRPLLAAAAIWPLVLLLRVTDRIGKGLRSAPRDALLAASIDAERRGLAFGLHRAMDHAGAVIGPLLAAALLAYGMAIRELIWWTALPGALALGLAFAVREAPLAESGVRTMPDWRWRALPPALRRYLVAVAVFSLANASNLFLLLKAADLGTPEAVLPLLWALVSLVASVLSTPLSHLSDRLGRRRLLLGGWLAYAGFYLAFGFLTPGTGGLLWPMFAFYGVFIAATEGVEKAYVADLAPPDQLGRAFGWFHLLSGLMLLPASVLFGFLWQKVAPVAAFSTAAAFAAAAAALLCLHRRTL